MADQESQYESFYRAEAFKFVKSLVEEFGIYSEELWFCLHAMTYCYTVNKNIPLLVARMKLVFRDRVEFIEGFNIFLKEGDKIPLPLSQSSNVESGDAAGFIMKLKEASSQNKERFTSFLELFNEYYTAGISLINMTQKTCDLFKDRQDLLEEFCTYMLHSDKEAMQDAVRNAAKEEDITLQTNYDGQAVKFVKSVVDEFGIYSEEFWFYLHTMADFTNNKNIPLLVARMKLVFRDLVEIIEGFNIFLKEGDKIALPLSQSSNVESGDAAGFIMKLKEASSQNKERFTSFLELFNEYYTAGISLINMTQKTCDLFKDRQDLLEEFCTYMLHSDKEAMQDAVRNAAKEEDITLQTNYDGQAVKFVNSVVDEFGIYSEEFWFYLHGMADFTNNKNVPLLVARMKLLFHDRVEFIEGFNKFLKKGDKIALPLSQSSNIESGDAAGFVMKLKEASSQNKERFTSFLELFNEYHTAGISPIKMTQKTCDLFKDRPDLLEEFCTYMLHSDEEAMQDAVRNAAKEEDITLQTKYIGGYF